MLHSNCTGLNPPEDEEEEEEEEEGYKGDGGCEMHMQYIDALNKATMLKKIV